MIRSTCFCVILLLISGCDSSPETEAINEPVDATAVESAVQRIVLLPELSSVVWIGDSITHRAGFTQYLETFFVTRFPHREWQFYNRGVAGDRAADVLARYADDSTAGAAKLAVLQLGMNDGGYRRWREETGAVFEKDLSALIDAVGQRATSVVMVSPTIYDVEAEWRDQLRDGEELRSEDQGLLGYDAVIARLDRIAQKIAKARGVPYVDVRRPMLEQNELGRKEDAAFSLVPDSLHPSDDGHALMAVTVLRTALWAPQPLNEIDIYQNETGKWEIDLADALLEDLTIMIGTEGPSWTLSFLLRPGSLPWMVPEEARVGFAVAGGESYNQERLRVGDLDAGSYLLSIDEFVAGTFTAQELAEGIDVGTISGTPQRTQAAEVADLNRVRNQGPVRSRQDWQADLKNRRAALAAIEDVEEKQSAQTEFDLWKETYRQALIDLEAEDEKLWNEILEAAQPKELRYELRRLPEPYRAFAE